MMSDRTTEIREAVAWADLWDGGEASIPDVVTLKVAARAYADLLDSDPLIIRRDENGEWPEWASKAIFQVLVDHNGLYESSDFLDALAAVVDTPKETA